MRAAIAFDLDGTLIDSAPDIRGIANDLLRAEGAEPLSMNQVRAFVGDGAPVFVARMRKARGIGDEAQERLLAGYLAAYDDALGLTVLYPGAAEALARLAPDHALSVCTNKPHSPTRAALAHFGLDARFSTVVAGDSLAVRKPDPGALAAAFAATPDLPRLFVGDSEVDAETAARADVPFLLFSGGYRKSDIGQLPHRAAFDHHDALPDLVADVLATL